MRAAIFQQAKLKHSTRREAEEYVLQKRLRPLQIKKLQPIEEVTIVKMEESMVKRFLEYKPPVPPSQETMQYQQGQRLQSQSPLHHYRLSNDKIQRPGGMACSPSPAASLSDSSESGLLPQARPPSGPKAKFTLEDDALLIELKEKHELTWKKISDFFPGRSSGTLQVRYCTKLKAKGVTWTDEMVGQLQPMLLSLNNVTDMAAGRTIAACDARV